MKSLYMYCCKPKSEDNNIVLDDLQDKNKDSLIEKEILNEKDVGYDKNPLIFSFNKEDSRTHLVSTKFSSKKATSSVYCDDYNNDDPIQLIEKYNQKNNNPIVKSSSCFKVIKTKINSPGKRLNLNIDIPQNEVNSSSKSITTPVFIARHSEEVDKYPSKEETVSSINSDYFQRVISTKEVKNSYKLIIEEDGIGSLLFKHKLEITAAGLKNGARGKNDGVTYFGTQLKQDSEIIADYKLNLESNTNINNGTQIFLIYYKRETNTYFLRACRDKAKNHFPLVFVKINTFYVSIKFKILKYFHNREIISIGDLSLKIEIIDKELLEIEILKTSKSKTTKKEDDTNRIYKFTKSTHKITIGRHKHNDIVIPEETTISKIQCTIIWDSDKEKWKILDGIDVNNPSTNGVWYDKINNIYIRVYASQSFEIPDQCIVKIGTSKLKISYN